MDMIHQQGHITKAYDAELNRLEEGLCGMADAVRAQLGNLRKALMNLNATEAEAVVAHDAEINDREVALDAFLEALISRRQPQANDLRVMLGSCRMTNDLERMGDEVRNAAKGVRNLAQVKIVPAQDISRLVATTLGISELADDMAKCIRTRDGKLARELLKGRTVVSSSMHQALVELIDHMRSGGVGLEVGLELIRINRALERVAAHIQNIGEAVIFIIEGVDIRHTN